MSGAIAGYCPACGSASLVVGEGGHITCTIVDCIDPTVVSDLLVNVSRAPSHRRRDIDAISAFANLSRKRETVPRRKGSV